ncbi:deoxyribodipyrimidine photo-lyase [Spirosoma sp. KCTC 42546]|uniref:cryptochrome/photolyase family protein n=1 Tax=Spirosoma sp. KCTC 42546 TaxID=2520506 RepID=UPI00115BBC16|nr:deoxyribodipyrimidine photo-lyase [Spirosoma sp. KCTC 42546]QDK82707.1 deoxyribodipyrimidine photo-lyase [Spirosoma sp. KCTC 42546]
MSEPLSLVWLRRDLRLHDNAALYYAFKRGRPVIPVFIFDRTILDDLDDRQDRRVEFLVQEVNRLHEELAKMGSTLLVRYGKPIDVWKELLTQYRVSDVFANHDYEVYAKERDKAIGDLLTEQGIGFHTSKDQTIFERDEVLTGKKTPYTVFTPYSRKWNDKLTDFYLKAYPTENYFSQFWKTKPEKVPTLAEMDFQPVGEPFPARTVSDKLLDNYNETRDFPALPHGTSQLGMHLRFGTVSIRELARQAREAEDKTFLNELCWRDFYFQVLDHFPHVETYSFRREYDQIDWRNNEDEFEKWCNGETGYPIVDAGMRQLNTIGWMHNRVRMITASFLCKHLLIDWRWGEAYFGKKLRDYDLSANNGGWQWAAGSGTDAAPYFRVFNPERQAQKFDPKSVYIRQWVPEVDGPNYPKPIVEHTMARQRAIDTYRKALAKSK